MATAKKATKKTAKKAVKKVAKTTAKKAVKKTSAKPVKKSAKKVAKKSVKKVAKKSVARRVAISTQSPRQERLIAPEPIETSVSVTKKKRPVGPIVALAVFVVAGSYLYSHNENDDGVAVVKPAPVISKKISTVKPTPVKSVAVTKTNEVVATPVKVPSSVLRSSFTSTGAKISWSSVPGASSYELKIQASGSTEARLVSLTSSDKQYALDKIDTVGSTTFTLTAVLDDGSSVRSKILTLSGQY